MTSRLHPRESRPRLILCPTSFGVMTSAASSLMISALAGSTSHVLADESALDVVG